MLISTFEIEKKLIKRGYRFIIGVDEAGRGPLAGPVVAGAVAFKRWDSLDEDPLFDLIRDSKTLSEKQREELFDFIKDRFFVGIGISDHKTIDRLNILEATYLAMKKALTDIARKINHNENCIILVDGQRLIPRLSLEQKAIVGGDSLVKSISAASIMAKVTRDRIMRDMHKEYPQYGFLSHKGYGTKIHKDAIKKYGLSAIHRKSFKPCNQYL